MGHEKFQVRPLKEYGDARYPSLVVKSPSVAMPAAAEPEEARHHPAEILLALVLVLGIGMGLIGCFADYQSDACAMGLLPRDVNGNCLPPDPDDDCRPGVVFCDDSTLMTCKQDGQSWASQDCDASCQETVGDHSFSHGCDAAADDPCQCEYDIVDGDIAFCSPGEVKCTNEFTLSTCIDTNWIWEEQDCPQLCQEQLGPDAYSQGCDAQAEDPCQCDYDVTMGVMAECTPGEFYCGNEDTVVICEGEWTWTDFDCASWCTDTFGEDYHSTGCDQENEEENPCGCTYGIVDGEPVP